MLSNYIRTALRVFVRQRTYSVINILGLAIGLGGCLLITTFVINELSFENFHQNRDRIYRVQGCYTTGGASITTACAVAALAPAMMEQIPEVETAVRFRQEINLDINVGDDLFNGNTALLASPEFFDVFTLPLAAGDPKTALNDPFSAVITPALAQKLFGRTDALGQVFMLQDTFQFKVSGVLQPVPPNTQLHADFIAPYSLMELTGGDPDSWDDLGHDYVYVLLHEDADPAAVDEKLPGIFAQHLEPEEAKNYELGLFPLKDIYLHSHVSWELHPSGEIKYVYLFSTIAILLLVIASINFINLATARTAHRLKEVGVRKVLGAQKAQLIRQFLGESILLTSVALLLSLVLLEFGKPQLEAFIGRDLALQTYTDLRILGSVVFMVLVVGVISGGYPALYLSRFQPAAVLKQGRGTRISGQYLRRFLVIFQFVIAVGLIFLSLTIYRQVSFFIHKDLGFQHQDVMVFYLGECEDAERKSLLLKDEITRNCRVASVSTCYNPPGYDRLMLTFIKSETQTSTDPIMVQWRRVDLEYLETFQIPLVEGRWFSQEFASDADNAIIINEAAIELLELGDPLGKQLIRRDKNLEIIGVLKDHHDLPLHKGIMPTIFTLSHLEHSWVTVRMLPGTAAVVLPQMTELYHTIAPDSPFEPVYLDDDIADNYNNVVKLGNLFAVFSGLAIFIACLGIFGLSAFTAEQRTREIGIRKVLGATIASILNLLSREVIILIAISNLIAWPIAWYLAGRWLEEFPYRTGLGPGLFILSGLLTLLMALVSIGFQVLKTANTDPVKSLRYE